MLSLDLKVQLLQKATILERVYLLRAGLGEAVVKIYLTGLFLMNMKELPIIHSRARGDYAKKL
jgi:hypothetical protein